MNPIHGIVQMLYKNQLPPLHAAALNGNKERVTELIKAGVDVNSKANDGLTALHIVAKEPNGWVMAEHLIESGADINAVGPNGITPLHQAVFLGYKETVEWFSTQKGVNLNAKNKKGLTPLDWAKIFGHTEMYEILLQAESVGQEKEHIAIAAEEQATTTRDNQQEERSITPTKKVEMDRGAVRIPITSYGHFKVTFPDKCVYCGKQKDTHLVLRIESKSSGKTAQTVLQVPYCQRHALLTRIDEQIVKFAGWSGFFVGMTVFGLTLFSPLQALLNRFLAQYPALYFILLMGVWIGVGGGVGWQIGLSAVGIFGKLVSKSLADMAALESKAYAGRRLGIGVSLSADSTQLYLWLNNQEVVQEVLQLNNQPM